MPNCKPEPCQPDRWAMQHLYRTRAKANFKLHRYKDALKDFFKKVDDPAIQEKCEEN